MACCRALDAELRPPSWRPGCPELIASSGPPGKTTGLRRGLGEVVDGLAADGFLREVGRDPFRDGRGALPAAEALAALAHVVMDLVLGHEPFEYGQSPVASSSGAAASEPTVAATHL
jgi:hypothetical protein